MSGSAVYTLDLLGEPGMSVQDWPIAEPFTIDLGNPATYQADWGGPSLIGVLVVHMLPGVVAAVLMLRTVRRRRRGGAVVDHPDREA